MKMPCPSNKPRPNALRRFNAHPGRVMALLGSVGETTMLVIEAAPKPGYATLCLGRAEQSLALDDLETLCLAGLEFIKEQRNATSHSQTGIDQDTDLGIAEVSLQGATREPG